MKVSIRLVLTVLLIAGTLFSFPSCGKPPDDEGGDTDQQIPPPSSDFPNLLTVDSPDSLPPGTIINLNDKENYWILVDGIQYKLGDPYSKILESNFKVSKFSPFKVDREVQPEESVNIKLEHQSSEGEFLIWVRNIGTSAAPVTKCIITCMDLSGYYESILEKFDHTFIGGIKINKSTIEDVRKVFGEPTSRFRNEESLRWIYKYSVEENVMMTYEFFFHIETEVLIYCRMNNWS